MIQLSDSQRAILSAACAREGGEVLPLPAHIKGGAVTKVIASLAAKGMVEEDGAGALVVTATAFAALGLEVPGRKAVRKARVGTKQEALIALLRRPEGASIAEIMEAANWQAHSVRGFISGSLKKSLGLEVTSEKVEAGGRVYRIRDC